MADNREMEFSDLLLNAARLIDRAVAKLDVRHEKCKCCNATVYLNPTHGRSFERIKETADRLADVARVHDEESRKGAAVAPQRRGE